MSLRRLRKDQLTVLWAIVPVMGGLFGAYQQFLCDQTYTLYRNKSKLFGGKRLEEGQVAWR